MQKPGKSAPGGLVLSPTRYEIGDKVRLVGKNGKLFRKPRLPFSFGGSGLLQQLGAAAVWRQLHH